MGLAVMRQRAPPRLPSRLPPSKSMNPFRPLWTLPTTCLQTARIPPSSAPQLAPLVRTLHSSPPRRDIFFLSIPAVKTGLLSITRFSLLFLPFVFRYK